VSFSSRKRTFNSGFLLSSSFTPVFSFELFKKQKIVSVFISNFSAYKYVGHFLNWKRTFNDGFLVSSSLTSVFSFELFKETKNENYDILVISNF